MNKAISAFAVVIFLVIIGAAFLYWGSWHSSPAVVNDTATTTASTTAPASAYDMIVVDNPLPNSTISSGITVMGRARGGWYFEASFPVWLYDSSGNVLALVPAQAQDSWMTSEYVPFKATLNFVSATPTGTLVLENDNPSGLPENRKALEIPVKFATYATSTMKVKLYLYKGDLDNFACSAAGLVAIERVVPKTSTPLTDAVRLLFKGEVTPHERSQGLTSEYPAGGVTLKSAVITNGVATLTLDDPQGATDGGACRVSVMKAQLEATAKQFSTVSSVKILPEGLFQP